MKNPTRESQIRELAQKFANRANRLAQLVEWHDGLVPPKEWSRRGQWAWVRGNLRKRIAEVTAEMQNIQDELRAKGQKMPPNE